MGYLSTWRTRSPLNLALGALKTKVEDLGAESLVLFEKKRNAQSQFTKLAGEIILTSGCLSQIDWGIGEEQLLWDLDDHRTFVADIRDLIGSEQGSLELETGVGLSIDDGRAFFAVTPELPAFLKKQKMRVVVSRYIHEKIQKHRDAITALEQIGKWATPAPKEVRVMMIGGD